MAQMRLVFSIYLLTNQVAGRKGLKFNSIPKYPNFQKWFAIKTSLKACDAKNREQS